MRIRTRERRGTGESIPRFTLRNRLVVFRPESSSRGLELSFSGLSRQGLLELPWHPGKIREKRVLL